MRLQRKSNQQIITLDPNSTLGHGGEARVYTVPQDETLVAKVYHKSGSTQARKLAAMLANPPENPMAGQGHISIAWPVDLLMAADGSSGRVAGFLMPRVQGMRSLLDFYNPKTRRQKCPFFNYLYLVRTARNIAAAVGALHARGYCVGDVNESNILVSDTALVTLVDTDSFQVRDPQTGTIFRCGVGKPEFTPPELQGKNFGQIDRAPEHDLFGLAVLIFQLLMEGTHPFSGIFQGTGDPPTYASRIAAGHFTYSVGRRVPYLATPIAPTFDILHPTLRQLFVQCFEDGHEKPHLRPSAQTWQAALKEAENALVTCSVNNQHRYSNHLQTCPWCERTVRLGGRDPFPSAEAVRNRQHLKPLPPKRTPVVYRQYRSDRPTIYYPATRIGSTPMLLTLPRTQKKLSRKSFNLAMLGLLSGGMLSMLGLMMVVSDVQLPFDSSISTSSRTNPVIQPNLANQNSDGFVAYYNQGNAYYKVGDYDSAIENYNQALRLNPKDAQAYLNRASARLEVAQHSGDPDRVYRAAIEDFNQSLRLKPNQGEAYLGRGMVRYEIAQYSKSPDRDYQQALNDFHRALRLSPQAAKAYVKRGNVHYKLAQYKGDLSTGYKAAIADFNKALSLNPQEAEAYLKRGIVRYELAQYNGHSDRAAVEDLQTAAKLFLKQGNIEEYQLALGNICVALDKNCDSFLRNPEKFILSVPQPVPAEARKGN